MIDLDQIKGRLERPLLPEHNAVVRSASQYWAVHLDKPGRAWTCKSNMDRYLIIPLDEIWRL